MIITRRTLLLGTAALGLAACDASLMEIEAGSDIDEGGFGNPTGHNRGVLTGELNVARIMSQRFAAEVPTVVHFDFNSSRLDGEAQEALRRQAAWIRRFPEIRFSVTGHTDLVGSERANHRLGQRRAQAVVAFLHREGTGRARVQAVTSRGQREPLIQTQEPERQNRRAETRITGFVRHPTEMRGRYAEIINREFIESATAEHPFEFRRGR